MSRLQDAWYRDAAWLVPLRPLAGLYASVMDARRRAYQRGTKTVWKPPVPLIVIGNLSVGGTGKSPLVAWMARWLAERGWHPGIVSRGYGGHARRYPLYVTPETSPAEAGDEPVMLAAQTGLPVAVDPDRPRAARKLIAAGCDILLSDDGLQHLAMGRDIELVVVDGARGFGNGRCLPAGPLRESLARLNDVDAVIGNGALQKDLPVPHYSMHLVPSRWRHLIDNVCYPIEGRPFNGRVHALAGIGHPSRFFETLTALDVAFDPCPLADHHRFDAADLQFSDNRPVVMTAKDAVKCRFFAHERCWVLDVEAHPDPALMTWLEGRLAALTER